MQWVICYDISDDRRRVRVVEALKDYGSRIQESVFVVFDERANVEELRVELGGLIDGEDKIHLFGICDGCWQSVATLGQAEKPIDPQFYIL